MDLLRDVHFEAHNKYPYSSATSIPVNPVPALETSNKDEPVNPIPLELFNPDPTVVPAPIELKPLQQTDTKVPLASFFPEPVKPKTISFATDYKWSLRKVKIHILIAC